jgi:hypothetical protein
MPSGPSGDGIPANISSAERWLATAQFLDSVAVVVAGTVVSVVMGFLSFNPSSQFSGTLWIGDDP